MSRPGQLCCPTGATAGSISTAPSMACSGRRYKAKSLRLSKNCTSRKENTFSSLPLEGKVPSANTGRMRWNSCVFDGNSKVVTIGAAIVSRETWVTGCWSAKCGEYPLSGAARQLSPKGRAHEKLPHPLAPLPKGSWRRSRLRGSSYICTSSEP